MKASTFRRIVRWIHIVGSGVVGTYIYSPYGTNPILSTLTLGVAFPLLAVSGIAMWQQARLQRLLRRA
ncbi:MAG: hypothetical protein AAF219_04345 [Myxococcota bacterium]